MESKRENPGRGQGKVLSEGQSLVSPSLAPRRLTFAQAPHPRSGRRPRPTPLPLRIPGFPRIQFRDFPPVNARIQWIVLLPPGAYAPEHDTGEPSDHGGESSGVQQGDGESEVRRHEEHVTAVVDLTGVSARGSLTDAQEAGEHIGCCEGARRPPGHRPAGPHPVHGEVERMKGLTPPPSGHERYLVATRRDRDDEESHGSGT